MNKRVFSFFFILSIILMIMWFRSGLLIATGEEGLLFYNPQRIFSKFSSSWLDVGLGVGIPAYIPQVPFYFVLVILRSILSDWLAQAVIFGLILFGGMSGLYILGTSLFPKSKQNFLLIATFFYTFNLFTQTQVWNRFLTPGMFLWAYLPWFLYFWITWIQKGQKKTLLWWFVSMFIFSNTFSTATFIITIWIPPIIYSMVALIKSKDSKAVILRSIAGLIFWITANLWWLYPFLTLGTATFSEVFSWKDNYDSLKGLSSALPIWHLFIFYHGLFMAVQGPWGNWYQNNIIVWISWLPFVLALIGILSIKKVKQKLPLIFCLVTGIFVLFLMKGTNPPFGAQFYEWFFSTIPMSGILRNPYEKLGSIWILCYAFFFAAGVEFVVRRKFIAAVLVVVTCVFLVWPMWTGAVYTTSVRLKVPNYYEELNQYINSKNLGNRLLVTPMLPGDGARYFWGYGGIEPSTFLFDAPSVARIQRNKLIDDKYYKLLDALSADLSYESHLNDMNIKYIVLQKDLDTTSSGASSSALVKNKLSNNPSLEFINSFGNLDLYAYRGTPKIITAIKDGNTHIEYEILNQTKYKISVSNSKEPFTIILKQTYHPKWEAKIDNQIVSKHIVALEYANGWIIEKTGDFQIDIYFKVWPWQ